MDFQEQAAALVAKMTLAEKVLLLSGKNFWYTKGVERLNVPSVMLTDGPHGLRKQTVQADSSNLNASVPATCFPTACATACSFDPALLQKIGEAIGEECAAEDVAVILGPGVNLKRSPLCGRNFEYFSEDPCLAGTLAAGFIEGVQSKNVGVSLKHFAANNQERGRMISESVIDERALRELYLSAFERAVKQAKPWTVMCAYNRLRGEYASESKWLLTDVLRREWGFEGLVMSDWGAVNDRVKGVAAGLDLEMPYTGGAHDRQAARAVASGALPEADVDACVSRVVALALKSRVRVKAPYDKTAHHALARRAAAESAVLLKNEGGMLPLRPGMRVAMLGAFAETPRYQGAGSSKIVPNLLDTPLDELRKLGVDAVYAPGYRLDTDAPDEALLAAAEALARDADAAVVFAGLPDSYESEGFDRTHLHMPESHVRLIERVHAANPNVAAVLAGGSVIDMDWEGNAKAILQMYLGGEAAGGAAADLLTGERNPCGKLAESWPVTLEENPSYAYFPGEPRSVEYRESVFVGYRYYDTAQTRVRYPFGYGLSYTSFRYENMILRGGQKDGIAVTVEIENTGDRDGAEIAELYVAPPKSDVFRPAQELRGFSKVFLRAGERKTVSFLLHERDFAFYDVQAHDWRVLEGDYEIRISSSSRDVRLADAAHIRANRAFETKAPDYRRSAPCYYDLTDGLRVSDAEFAAVYGAALPPSRMQPGERFTRNASFTEIKSRPAGRVFARIVEKEMRRRFAGQPDMLHMSLGMLESAPLRMLSMAGGDAFGPDRVDGLAELLNGRLDKALPLLLHK